MSEEELHIKISGLLETAIQQFLVKDYDQAIRSLKSAEVLDKNNPEIIYNLAVSYCQKGLYNTALKYLKRILVMSMTFVDMLTIKKLTAFCLIKLEEHTEAETYLNDVIKATPSDTTAHSLKGYSLEKQEKLQEAEIAFRAIIDIEPGNYNAHNSLAYILAHQNRDLDEALNHAKIACKANNKNPAYLDTLGYIYLKKGNHENAKKCLTIALKKSPLSEEIKQHAKDVGIIENS